MEPRLDVTVNENWTSFVARLGVSTFLAAGVFLCFIPYSGMAEDVPASSGTVSGPPQTHEVRILRDAFKFDPSLLKVRPGDTVVWINEGDVVHFLASIPGAGTHDKEMLSPMMKPGDKWTHTFEKAGDYPYMCFIHNQMLGAVVVEAEGVSEPPKEN